MTHSIVYGVFCAAVGIPYKDTMDIEGGVTRISAGHTVVRILGGNAHKLTGVTEWILTV